MPLVGLAVAMGLLLLVERWIHRHLQGTMLLFTGDRKVAVILYALFLLPGVFLHEISHALVAMLLGVRVGRISLRPKMADQRIQLGFVPVEETDVVRASLIGLAPLLTGSAIILLIGHYVFGISTTQSALVSGNWDAMIQGLQEMLKAPDALLWAYVVFAVSNTMFPSRSDRQAWTPVFLFLILLTALIWAAGLGPAIVNSLSSTLSAAVYWLLMVYVFTLVADLPFVLFIVLTEKLLGHLKGVRVDYKGRL